MHIEHEIRADLVLVLVHAQRIDATGAAAFTAAVGEVLAPDRRVVLDLGEVTFIDSTGLGAIVGLLRHPAAPRSIAVAGARAQVEVVFRLTRMTKVFRMFPTSSEALATLAS